MGTMATTVHGYCPYTPSQWSKEICEPDISDYKAAGTSSQKYLTDPMLQMTVGYLAIFTEIRPSVTEGKIQLVLSMGVGPDSCAKILSVLHQGPNICSDCRDKNTDPLSGQATHSSVATFATDCGSRRLRLRPVVEESAIGANPLCCLTACAALGKEKEEGEGEVWWKS